MDGLSITKTVFIVLMLIVGLVTSFAALLRSSLSKTELPLRYVFKSLIISHLLAFLVNCSNLLIGTISGSWPLGNTACQVFGFTSLVLTAGAIWTFAIAAMDKYYLFLLPSEHPCTFSQKNLNILMAGIYILIILVATGPLYGLGEYSHFKGHIEMTIYVNSTLQNTSEDYRLSLERRHVSVLHQMVMSQNFNNPLLTFSNYLDTQLGIKTSRVSWIDRGTKFILRAYSKNDAMNLWETYQDNGLVMIIANHLWRYELLRLGNIQNVIFQAYIDRDEFQNYLEVYLPSQGLGQCNVDFTSPQVHATVWSGYQLSITTVLPYLIVLLAYIILFCKNPYTLTAFHKCITSDDIASLQVFCISSIICCVFSAVYYGVNILNANGTFVSENVLFVMTYLYYASNIAVFTPALLTECACLATLKSKCQLCWMYSRESITNEITEIKLKQTRRKFSIPMIHYNHETKFKPRHI